VLRGNLSVPSAISKVGSDKKDLGPKQEREKATG